MHTTGCSALKRLFLGVLLSALSTLPVLANLGQGRVAEVDIRTSIINFYPVLDFDEIRISVAGERCKAFQLAFEAGEEPYLKPFDPEGNTLPEGRYTFELRGTPKVSGEVQEILKRAREEGNEEEVLEELRERGLLPDKVFFQTGYFSVKDGRFILPILEEGGLTVQDADLGNKDQVIPDDLIVDGSLCVGFDCVNNENFGFDTIRLKENNLRIKFQDTSVGGFPSRDWQLTANDSASGGASRFSIDDVDGGLTPFTIEAGAPSNSLYVDNGGRIGRRTSNPVLDLHIVNGNTPAIRLDQDGSSGFTPQVWDIGANEANFFVRDVTGGSQLPFRIRHGAPSNSIDIGGDGDVGIGTASANAALHVRRTDRTASLLVEEATGGAAAEQTMLTLRNKGNVNFNLENTSPASTWQFRNTGAGGFTITLQGSGGASLRVSPDHSFAVGNPGGTPNFQVAANGNATLAGTLTEGSDRNQKKNITPVEGSVLERLAQVPISLWSYNWDAPEVRHLGPMAQDFHAAFGLGATDKGIAVLDAAGVALAAIQELDQQLDAKEKELGELQQHNAELEARLAALEALVASLSR